MLIGKIVKWFGVLVLALVLLSAGYNQVSLIVDASLAPDKSDMVLVNGRQIHVRCTGNGSRTIVLDAGLGAWSIAWFRIQPALAKHARVCAFDRSGMGWSDDLGGGHDGAAVAEELHAIVAAAKISKPFVYVGHSLGANFAQIYYAKYPTDVAGLVLMEPGDPKDLLEDFNGTRADAMMASDCDWVCDASVVASHLGIPRLAAMLAGAGSKNLPPELRAQYRAGLARPSTVKATVAYYRALPKTAYQTIDVSSFGTVPLLVLASSHPRKAEGDETPEMLAQWEASYRAYLASLAAKSTSGRGPLKVPQSDHATMVFGQSQGAWVAASIADFLAQTEAREPSQ